MTSQGLIDHLYATSFGKKTLYTIWQHTTIFTKYVIERLMLKKVRETFAPQNSMNCFKEITIKR